MNSRLIEAPPRRLARPAAGATLAACRNAAGIAIVALGPFVVHLALSTGRHETAASVIASFQVAIGAAMITRGSHPLRRAGPALAFAGMFVACRLAFRPGVVIEAGIAHALLYITLLTVFLRSLRAGRAPVAAVFAVRLGGPRSPAVLAYCRGATKAWCVFFAAQLLISASLLATASTEDWSFFVNALDLPSLALMFLGEYAYRRLHLRHEKHISIADAMRAFRDNRDG